MNTPQPLHRQLLGKRGEDIAASYLRRQGYRIVFQNFKARYGELDIVALDKNILVFVEVKTRIGTQYGTPEEAITPRKIRELVKTAQYFTLTHPTLPEEQRMDVIAIEMNDREEMVRLNHIKNITG